MISSKDGFCHFDVALITVIYVSVNNTDKYGVKMGVRAVTDS